MKKPKAKVGKYLINPSPFAMIVSNPGARKKRRNPGSSRSEVRSPTSTKTATRAHTSGNVTVTGGAGKGSTTVTIRRNAVKRTRKAAKKSPGIFVERLPTKNPAPSPTMKTRRRKKSRRRNTVKARRRARSVVLPAPSRKRRSTRRRNSVKRRSARRRKIVVLNPMSKNKRRRGKSRRSRNPISRRGARRSGRRSSRRMRNPIPVVHALFNSDMLSLAAGVVGANIGTTMIMNRLVAGDPATGSRTFDLPGVDYTMLGNPATQGQFYSKNAWILAIYKTAIGGVAGYLLRNQSPRLARGIMIGTVATAISDVMRNTGVLSPSGTLQLARGTGRNFGAGVGLLPGTNTRFTGPGQRFLTNNNVPRPRGMGAAVGPGMMRQTQEAAERAFDGAN